MPDWVRVGQLSGCEAPGSSITLTGQALRWERSTALGGGGTALGEALRWEEEAPHWEKHCAGRRRHLHHAGDPVFVTCQNKVAFERLAIPNLKYGAQSAQWAV